MAKHKIFQMLSEPKDLESIGKAKKVSKMIMRNSNLVNVCIRGIRKEDRVIATRCSDSFVYVSRKLPEVLQSRKNQLINLLEKTPSNTPEIKANLLLTIVNLQLTEKNKQKVAKICSEILQKERNPFLIENTITSYTKITTKNKQLQQKASKEIARFKDSKNKSIQVVVKIALKKLK